MTLFRTSNWVVVGLAIGMSAAPWANAAAGFQPVSPDELKMTSEALAPGAPAIILSRQVDRDDSGSTGREDDYLRIKILTEEGRKYANVEIPFLTQTQKVVDIKGRTIRPDGSIADFDGKVYEKELMKGKVQGRAYKYLAKTFTLPDVQVGAIIEYSYVIDFGEHKVFNSDWILSSELFTKKAQFSLKPFTSSYGVRMSLRCSWPLLPRGTDPPQEGKDHIYRMEANNIPAFQTEDYMPPPNDLKYRVDFIYEPNLLATDQASYWSHVAKVRGEDLESFLGKPKVMAQALAQIVSPGDVQEVQLRKIYDRVQQVRNTTYELRKTQQEEKREKEKTAENVEDVWKRGYGNSVQLTWLFLGLVRAAGFESYGCWVSSRKDYFFTPVSLQSAKLNMPVVLVKMNGKDLYFDPGVPFAPFGLLAWSETGVQGLRLDKGDGTWIVTTLPPASASRVERVGKLKLSDAGDLEGKLTVTYTGLVAVYHRLEERHADEIARKKSLEEAVTSQIGGAAQADLTNQPDWTSSETPLVAEFNLKITGWTVNAGKRVLIPAAIFTVGEKTIFEHANRVHPVYFEYPYEKVDDLTIDLPPGWQVSGVPPAQDQDQHVVHFAEKAETNPGTLRLTRKLTIDFMLLEQKYYAALRKFFETVRTADAQEIVLQPSGIHASN